MRRVLSADIGGTNANLCIAEINDEITITNQARESTNAYDSFEHLINNYLDKIDQKPETACFAAAGPVVNQKIKMTNANLVIDAELIKNKTSLKNVLLINDFDAVGYATNVLSPTDIKILNKGEPEKRGTRAAIGAGTGLGKSILIYGKEIDAYLPHPSEGGHSDFPVQNNEEFQIVESFEHPTYEDLLSGRGLEYLYRYFQKKGYPDENPNLSAKDISKNRESSPCCKKTFDTFVLFYARCARNFALEVLALGGIYIAGGIAAANHPHFETLFMEEFTRHPLYQEILRKIPVILIRNYDISLKGAAFALKTLCRRT